MFFGFLWLRKNAKIVIFVTFIYVTKNQYKIMIFVILGIPKNAKTLIFWIGFCKKMKILTSQHLDGQKKIFQGGSDDPKMCVLDPFFGMPR